MCVIDTEQATLIADNVVAHVAAQAILNSLQNKTPHAVGIDGPLIPGFGHTTQYRACEKVLSRGDFQRHGKPGATSSKLGQRLHREATFWAKEVKHMFRGLPENRIVEAFPNAFLGVLVPLGTKIHRGKKSDAYFHKAVENGALSAVCGLALGPNGKQIFSSAKDLSNHDQIAAFVCALSAACALKGIAKKVGSGNDGWIQLPPLSMMQSWAKIALEGF
jgi:hypothetical protein